jgi:hypothetical protein
MSGLNATVTPDRFTPFALCLLVYLRIVVPVGAGWTAISDRCPQTGCILDAGREGVAARPTSEGRTAG